MFEIGVLAEKENATHERIYCINDQSRLISTKMGVVKAIKVIVNREVDHHKEDFAECKTFADQEPIRMAMIRKALEEEGIALSDLDAVSGRGVGLYPCAGGTYKIDELAYEHGKK